MKPLITAVTEIATVKTRALKRLRNVHAAVGSAPSPSSAGYRLAR